ncbi:axoneme-associated protein mst101(1)-like [Drosophila kikkawai]|uniref:Axoneme-associated protein mst101(1)-like n=1 Tax=Drosophila kikkawai TaxID=30033 RepID=A0A6P4IRX6_DROKI|nr:uncharacterized protein LOC108080853 [Drosophila kikkawai]
MATIVRQFTRSAVRQLGQPRWNRLLLKSNMNLHLAIYQPRQFGRKPDDGFEDSEDQEEVKACIDYKKNPTIEGHVPPDLPDLQPACPQLKIAKRREFLKKKKCQELEDKENNDPCASFSRKSLIWGKPKIRISLIWPKIISCLMPLLKLRSLDLDLVYLNQERTFCKKVELEQACLAPEPTPTKPVPPKSQRMARKRRHFQAKQKKEAEAKEKAFAMLKLGSNSNLQPKEDLKIANSRDLAEQIKKSGPKPYEAFTQQAEIKQLLKVIKGRCRKKSELFEKSREAESKKKAEEAALRNKNKMAQIRKLCEEAKKINAFKMALLKKLGDEAQQRTQSIEAKPRNQSEQPAAQRRHTAPKCNTELPDGN